MQVRPEFTPFGVTDPRRLAPYLERRGFAQGECLMRQGTAGSECYLIEGVRDARVMRGLGAASG